MFQTLSYPKGDSSWLRTVIQIHHWPWIFQNFRAAENRRLKGKDVPPVLCDSEFLYNSLFLGTFWPDPYLSCIIRPRVKVYSDMTLGRKGRFDPDFLFCLILLIFQFSIFFLIFSYSSFACWFVIYDVFIFFIFHLFIFQYLFSIIQGHFLFPFFSLFFPPFVLCFSLLFRSGQQIFVCITSHPDFPGC